MDPVTIAIGGLALLWGKVLHNEHKAHKAWEKRYYYWLGQNNKQDSEYNQYVFSAIEGGVKEIMTENEWKNWCNEESLTSFELYGSGADRVS